MNKHLRIIKIRQIASTKRTSPAVLSYLLFKNNNVLQTVKFDNIDMTNRMRKGLNYSSVKDLRLKCDHN